MRLITVPLYFPLFSMTAPRTQLIQRDRRLSDPLNIQRHAVSVSYLLFYLIHLARHGLCRFRSLQGRSLL